MPNLTPFDENNLGFSHGSFGQFRFNERAANAYADRQEIENKSHSGKHWLRVSARAGLVGILIGAGFTFCILSTMQMYREYSFFLGIISGCGLTIAIKLSIPRILRCIKHCWNVYWNG